MPEKKVLISLKHINKGFGSQQVLRDISLDIYDGEFLTLLGPSGCGKTTLLRMINGFETPDSGTVELDGVNQSNIPPNHRAVNTVFQSYALFPHLSVRDNIAYGLRMKKTPAEEIQRRVEHILELTKLEALAERKPGKLSGGQQQRVAIARSLVNEPRVLLLDEPLGALDLKLRKQMQIELRQIQRASGITYVYVTHDQEEALTLSDRIVVLNEGHIEQEGASWDIYHHPKTEFVASFLGESNFFPGDLAGGDVGTKIAVRPEFIQLSSEAPADFSLGAQVRKSTYLGLIHRIELTTQDGNTVCALSNTAYPVGDTVFLSWDPSHAETISPALRESK